MTREEEIKKAVQEFIEERKTAIGRAKRGGWYFANIFEEGIKWADEHPKLSWISVKDDLPCNHKELLSGEHNTKGVEVVFQDRGSGKRRVEVRSMIKGIQNRNSKSIAWYWNAYWDADIIYWRPIPEPPSD